MAPGEIPKGVGVGVEGIGMDEDAVGVVEGSGSQQRNLKELRERWSTLHVKCLTVVFCNDLFGKLQIVVGYQKMTLDSSCFSLAWCSSMKTPL